MPCYLSSKTEKCKDLLSATSPSSNPGPGSRPEACHPAQPQSSRGLPQAPHEGVQCGDFRDPARPRGPADGRPCRVPGCSRESPDCTRRRQRCSAAVAHAVRSPRPATPSHTRKAAADRDRTSDTAALNRAGLGLAFGKQAPACGHLASSLQAAISLRFPRTGCSWPEPRPLSPGRLRPQRPHVPTRLPLPAHPERLLQ